MYINLIIENNIFFLDGAYQRFDKSAVSFFLTLSLAISKLFPSSSCAEGKLG